MSKALTSDIPADEAGELQEAINHILTEIQISHEQMERDQQDIERMKARTRAMLDQLEKV